MTIEQAETIVDLWGEHLRCHHAMLWTLFPLGSIPRSFLPYPNDVLWEAINVAGKYYFDLGDHERSGFLKSLLGPTAFYVEDEQAIEHHIKLLNLPKMKHKEAILSKLKEYRDQVAAR